MLLKTVVIKNFRTIENLQFALNEKANVIVGPNAIGKTTLLEAIRLTKATLAPRTMSESQQALMSLGAISPHNPTRLNIGALARDTSRPVEIDLTVQLTPAEITTLDALIPQLAVNLVRGMVGGAITPGPLARIIHPDL